MRLWPNTECVLYWHTQDRLWSSWEQERGVSHGMESVEAKEGENTKQWRLDSSVLGAFMFEMELRCPCGLLTKQQTKHVWGTLWSATSSRIVSRALTLLCGRARVTHALRLALDAAPSVDPE